MSDHRAVLNMAAMLFEAGYKGDGVVDGLEWALARAVAAEAVVRRLVRVLATRRNNFCFITSDEMKEIFGDYPTESRDA